MDTAVEIREVTDSITGESFESTGGTGEPSESTGGAIGEPSESIGGTGESSESTGATGTDVELSEALGKATTPMSRCTSAPAGLAMSEVIFYS